MNIKDLKDKIINLDDFFRLASYELKRKMGFRRINFLMPNGMNGDFVASNSSYSVNIRLTKKELYVINDNLKQDIFYLKTTYRCDCLLKRFLLIKIKWKLWLYGISVIMPIYYDGKFICLLIFKDRIINRQHHCLKKIQQELTDCLGSILLYNQALEGIIKNRHHSSE